MLINDKIRIPMRLKDRLLVYLIGGILVGVILLFVDIHSDLDVISSECSRSRDKVKNYPIYTVSTNNVTTPVYYPYKNRENFNDLINYIKEPKRQTIGDIYKKIVVRTTLDLFNPRISDLQAKKTSINPWDDFYLSISKQYLYDEKDTIVSKIISDMKTLPIIHAEEIEEMHVKVEVVFPNERRAFFKPKRRQREAQPDKNLFYFADFDRHNAEIAAFHLDRILGFRRVMPAVGRIIDITKDLKEKSTFRSQFFTSPANNTCWRSESEAYGDLFHPVCGQPEQLEGAFIMKLPSFSGTTRKLWISPWSRSFNTDQKAKWETDKDYCRKKRKRYPYNRASRMLDVMDIAIFDFLMGNQNRRSFESFEIFGNDTFVVLDDNGRGFGSPFYDSILILAPLYQCCIIKETTLNTLLKYHNGPQRLSNAMRDSLAQDPIAPILWEPHLIALDRRIELILKEVRSCISRKQIQYN